MELLFVCDEFVTECWFVTLEVDGASKDSKVGEAGLSAVAVVERRSRIAMFINDIFGRASIDDMGGICMSMVEEGTSKSGIVEECVGSVMNFTPFSFTDAIHFLMFRSSSFQFDSHVRACRDKFG